MHALKQQHITLNRKVLADLAMNRPDVFATIVKQAMNG
jgi:ribosomal protein L20